MRFHIPWLHQRSLSGSPRRQSYQTDWPSNCILAHVCASWLQNLPKPSSGYEYIVHSFPTNESRYPFTTLQGFPFSKPIDNQAMFIPYMNYVSNYIDKDIKLGDISVPHSTTMSVNHLTRLLSTHLSSSIQDRSSVIVHVVWNF